MSCVPDETYSVYQLADLLDVSRSPVREALLRLAEAGLVQINRNRGFRVVIPQARDIEEIIDIRLALEPAAARRAAEHATDDEHAAIRAAFDAMGGRERERRRGAASGSLTTTCTTASCGPEATGGRPRSSTGSAPRPHCSGRPPRPPGGTLPQIRAEHEPIVTAILRRDGAGAERAMRRHLEHTGRLLARTLHRAPLEIAQEPRLGPWASHGTPRIAVRPRDGAA